MSLVERATPRRSSASATRRGAPSSTAEHELELLTDDEIDLLAGLEIDLFGGHERLTMELATASEPLTTNGTFDPASGVVRWAARSVREDCVQPFYCYAAWARPDEERQQTRFGAVVLQGGALFEYALWYAGLDEDEVEEWSRLLADTISEQELTGRLERFRFQGEPAVADPSGSEPHTERGVELLLQALEPD